MGFDLRNPRHFIKMDPNDNGSKHLYVCQINVPPDSSSVKEVDWQPLRKIEYVAEFGENDLPLKVNGHELSSYQFLRLVRRLNSRKFVVNCQGLCYVEVREDDTYVRVFDSFNWASYGVKNYHFPGFKNPKDLDGVSVQHKPQPPAPTPGGHASDDDIP